MRKRTASPGPSKRSKRGAPERTTEESAKPTAEGPAKPTTEESPKPTAEGPAKLTAEEKQQIAGRIDVAIHGMPDRARAARRRASWQQGYGTSAVLAAAAIAILMLILRSQLVEWAGFKLPSSVQDELSTQLSSLRKSGEALSTEEETTKTQVSELLGRGLGYFTGIQRFDNALTFDRLSPSSFAVAYVDPSYGLDLIDIPSGTKTHIPNPGKTAESHIFVDCGDSTPSLFYWADDLDKGTTVIGFSKISGDKLNSTSNLDFSAPIPYFNSVGPLVFSQDMLLGNLYVFLPCLDGPIYNKTIKIALPRVKQNILGAPLTASQSVVAIDKNTILITDNSIEQDDDSNLFIPAQEVSVPTSTVSNVKIRLNDGIIRTNFGLYPIDVASGSDPKSVFLGMIWAEQTVVFRLKKSTESPGDYEADPYGDIDFVVTSMESTGEDQFTYFGRPNHGEQFGFAAISRLNQLTDNTEIISLELVESEFPKGGGLGFKPARPILGALRVGDLRYLVTESGFFREVIKPDELKWPLLSEQGAILDKALARLYLEIYNPAQSSITAQQDVIRPLLAELPSIQAKVSALSADSPAAWVVIVPLGLVVILLLVYVGRGFQVNAREEVNSAKATDAQADLLASFQDLLAKEKGLDIGTVLEKFAALFADRMRGEQMPDDPSAAIKDIFSKG